MDSIDGVALPDRSAQEQVPEELLDAQSSEASTVAAPSEPETPATSHAPSETDGAQTTPVVPAEEPVVSPKATPKQSQAQHVRRDTRTAVAIPIIPGLARAKASSPSAEKMQESVTPKSEKSAPSTDEQKSETAETLSTSASDTATVTMPPKLAPMSWAAMARRNAPASSAGIPQGGAVVNGVSLPKSASLADALKQYSVQNDTRLSFLEPRGLVNTGNMCYMNSVCFLFPDSWRPILICVRFSKFLYFVHRSITSWTRFDSALYIQ